MLNNINLVGRICKDVELKYLGNGAPVATFTLAVNRTFKNKDGEREADFIPIVVWRKQAENVANYVGKGSQVAVSGRLQTRNYENSEGKRVYITEVVAEEVHFLDSKKREEKQSDMPEGLHPLGEDESDLPF